MKKGWFKEFWPYRELFFFLAWRDVKIRYRQTVLGAAWAVIQPLLTMLVFTILFTKLAKVPSDGIPYPIFTYSALLLWTYFSGALAGAANSLLGNSDLIRKVYFPRATLPASSILAGLIDLFIGAILLCGMMAYYRIPPGWQLVFLPALIIQLVILAFGIGLILAALNIRYRDIKHALPFAIQLWMFLSPIAYPTSIVPERFRLLIAFNPLTGVIEATRASIFPGRRLDWQLLQISVGLTLLIFALGTAFFKRTERAFADII